jgi:hypothetical protein
VLGFHKGNFLVLLSSLPWGGSVVLGRELAPSVSPSDLLCLLIPSPPPVDPMMEKSMLVPHSGLRVDRLMYWSMEPSDPRVHGALRWWCIGGSDPSIITEVMSAHGDGGVGVGGVAALWSPSLHPRTLASSCWWRRGLPESRKVSKIKVRSLVIFLPFLQFVSLLLNIMCC